MNKKIKQILSAILAGTLVTGTLFATIQMAKAQESLEDKNGNNYINEELTDDFHKNNDISNIEKTEQPTEISKSQENEKSTESSLNTKTDKKSSIKPKEVSDDNLGENSDKYEVPFATDSFRYQNGNNIAESEKMLNTLEVDDARDSYNPVTPDGRYPTGHAIDVSRWQGNIDWKKVKASDNADFAILRLGSGYDIHTEGDKWIVDESSGDAKFKEYAKECNKLGIPIGAYFFSYADSVEDAKREAQLALEMLKGVKVDYPIYYDLEDNATTGTQSSRTIAEMAKVFNDTLSKAGYQVGVYASKSWFNNELSDPYFKTQRQWVAQYYKECTYDGNYEMWQYTSKGSINGINGSVDMNFWYGDTPNSSPKVSAYVDSNESTITITATNVKNAKSVSFPVWTSSNGQDDLKWHKATQIGLNTWSAVVPVSEHNNERGQYNIHAYLTDMSNKESLFDNTSCFLSDIVSSSIIAVPTNDNDASVDITIRGLTSNHSISKVDASVWSDVNGKDDLIWYNAQRQYNGNYSFNFKPIDHKLNVGKYNIEVYATDTSGFRKMIGSISHNVPTSITPTLTAKPNLKNKSIDISVKSDADLKSVLFPVWTDKNGQDDIIWYTAKKQSENEWTFSVPISNHNNENGNYIIHCYYNYNNSMNYLTYTNTFYQDFSQVKVSSNNISNDDTKFQVNIKNVPNISYLNKITVAVWSDKDGTDDLRWYNIDKNSNGNYNFIVDSKNHKNTQGKYFIDVYFILQDQRKYISGTTHNISFKTDNPIITVKTNDVHDSINVTINNLFNANNVSIPIWTDKNGQDDIIWHNAYNKGNGIWEINVPISKHNNELGLYNVHVYYRNQKNELKSLYGTTVTIDKITCNSIDKTILNSNNGTFKINIMGVKSPAPIKKITAAVWSDEGGTDDLIWYNTKYESNNSYSVIIDPINHKNTSGKYFIDIYGVDSRNISIFVNGTTHNVKSTLSPTITVNTDVDNKYILINARGLKNANSVSFPVWTSNKGQDDLIWHSASKQSNGTWTAKIPISQHKNETGTYIVHAYYRNSSNNLVAFGNSSVIIKDITAKSISANLISDGKFKIVLYNVSSPAGIKQVQIPVWSAKNGQDDIIWYSAKNEGNGTYSLIVDTKKHKNDTGTYHIHAYAKDNRNINKLVSNTSIDISKKHTKNFGFISKVK